MTFFSCRLLATPFFRRRSSSVLSFFLNSATSKIISFGCHPFPWMVSPGAVRLPPSDATVTMVDSWRTPLSGISHRQGCGRLRQAYRSVLDELRAVAFMMCLSSLFRREIVSRRMSSFRLMKMPRCIRTYGCSCFWRVNRLT